jgi:protocatechuate 3,4-dioxygenase beta subunit
MSNRTHRSADHSDFGGLQRDLRGTRRQLLTWIGGAGLAAFVASCLDRDASETTDDGSTDDSTDDTSTGTCSEIPEETAGPYPGDGSNGPNVLATSGVVRSDITTSFGGLSGTAAGIPLTVKLKLVDASNGCQTLEGYVVYLWHCDAQGRYSLYSSGVTNQNFLRGVQEVDAEGYVTFTTIFPGCYDGRWPHIHFEIYPSLDQATASSNKIATSQLALPEAACASVYATSGYPSSASNLAGTSLSSDNVFGDGSTEQLATVTGSTSAGFTATLHVGVAA